MDHDFEDEHKKTREKIIYPKGGCFFLLMNFLILLIGIAIIIIFTTAVEDAVPVISLGVVLIIAFFINNFGFFTIQPNEANIVTYCGSYIGTVKENGFFWMNPFYGFQKISLKARNLNGAVIKVNDKDGSPIEIAIVVVWKVNDTAQAVFDVENYTNYLTVQSESAIRHVASSYSYDKHNDNEPSLRGLHKEVIDTLTKELAEKTKDAGILILDARITHLAYSSEISNAMLKRQQAQAIIDARQKIIHGACGIVREAVTSLENSSINMTDEQKTLLASNLLVVLCSENQTTPVINTGASSI